MKRVYQSSDRRRAAQPVENVRRRVFPAHQTRVSFEILRLRVIASGIAAKAVAAVRETRVLIHVSRVTRSTVSVVASPNRHATTEGCVVDARFRGQGKDSSDRDCRIGGVILPGHIFGIVVIVISPFVVTLAVSSPPRTGASQLRFFGSSSAVLKPYLRQRVRSVNARLNLVKQSTLPLLYPQVRRFCTPVADAFVQWGTDSS